MNTKGDANIAVGYFALNENTTGSPNLAVGYASLQRNTTGIYNTGVGYQSLNGNTTGNYNTGIGPLSLTSNTTGQYNIALGYAALYSQTTSTGNNAVGYLAGYNTTASSNNYFGYYAGYSVTSGTYNVFIGEQAGYYSTATTTGSSNVIVGALSRTSGATVSDEIVIGVDIAGKGTQTAFIDGSSGAYNGKNVTTWETTSDERIKKNIVDNAVGLEKVKQVRVRNFEYRKPEEITELPDHAAIKKDGVQLGVIAQEIREVLPECVTENSTGVLSVNTDPLLWHLINAVKELSAQVEKLKVKLGDK